MLRAVVTFFTYTCTLANLIEPPCSSPALNNSFIFYGTLEGAHSEGAMGYFSMSIAKDGSYSNYTARLDLSQFKTPCDVSRGLMFHLHSYWSAKQGIYSGSNDECLIDKIGGHYGMHFNYITFSLLTTAHAAFIAPDPFFACGEWSTYNQISSKCSSLKRVSPSYEYRCNPSSYFEDGMHHMCEVGDLSGKFGMLFPSVGGTFFDRTFTFDPVAPIMANFKANEDDHVSAAWSSVAFHCHTGEPLLCASLKLARCE